MKFGTIESGGVEKSTEDWGIENLIITQQSQADESCTFTAHQEMDAELLFAKDAVCIVRGDRVYSEQTGTYSGGRVWFYGIMRKPRRSGDGQKEAVSYELCGPTWFMRELPFTQCRRYWAGKFATWDQAQFPLDGVAYVRDGEDVYARVTHTTTVLNQGEDGRPQTLKEQIVEILSLLVAAGAPMSYDAAELQAEFGDLQCPTTERPDVPCATALDTVLAYTPDCEVWFDHDQNGAVPVCHIRRRANLTLKTFSAVAGDEIEGLNIDERDDLRKEQVVITYSRPTEINGESFVWTFDDRWPDTDSVSPFKVLRQSVNLVGWNVSTFEGELEVETLPDEFWLEGVPSDATKEWWKSIEPSLDNCTIYYITAGVLTIDGETAESRGELTLPNRLMSGTIEDWMGVTTQRVTVTAKVKFLKPDGISIEERTFSASFIATDAVSKVYNSSTINTYGEEVPGMSGFDAVTRTPSWTEALRLSKQVWTALNEPQFEGSFTMLGDEPTSAVGLGCKVSLTGGRAEWATMAMPVKRVIVDAFTGKVSVSFGPNRFLTSGELVDLMRSTRVRVVTSMTYNRAQGRLSAAAGGPTKESATTASSPGADATSGVLAVQGETSGTTKPTLKMDGAANSIQLAYLFASGATRGSVDTSKPRVNISPKDLQDVIEALREAKFRWLYAKDARDGCKLKRCKVLGTDWETVST